METQIVIATIPERVDGFPWCMGFDGNSPMAGGYGDDGFLKGYAGRWLGYGMGAWWWQRLILAK